MTTCPLFDLNPQIQEFLDAQVDYDKSSSDLCEQNKIMATQIKSLESEVDKLKKETNFQRDEIKDLKIKAIRLQANPSNPTEEIAKLKTTISELEEKLTAERKKTAAEKKKISRIYASIL